MNRTIVDTIANLAYAGKLPKQYKELKEFFDAHEAESGFSLSYNGTWWSICKTRPETKAEETRRLEAESREARRAEMALVAKRKRAVGRIQKLKEEYPDIFEEVINEGN
jgi:hypothetical protein